MALWLLLGAAWQEDLGSTTSRRSEIIAALGSLDPSTGRLQGFPYSQPGQGDLARLYKDLVKDMKAVPGPRIRGEVAILALAGGHPERAVELLEAAVAVDSTEKASLYNDLAVAYLARGEALGDPSDFIRALDAATLAAAAGPRLHAPCFNRALALERLHLVLQSTAAWADCVRREPDPEWKHDMTRRLADLRRAAKRVGVEQASLDGLSAARSRALEEILPAWGKAFLDGKRTEADTAFRQGRALGRDLARRSHDFMVADAFETIARESANPAGRLRLIALAQAVQLYKEALAAEFRSNLHRKFHFCQNEENLLFEQARTLFSKAGSILEVWAELGAIKCELDRNNVDEIFVRLEALRPQVNAERFPLLAGRWHWINGIAHFQRGELHATLREVEATVDHYKRARELETLGASYHLLSKVRRRLSDEDKAWRYQILGLTLLRDFPRSKRRILLLRDIAESALVGGYNRAALAIQDEVEQADSGIKRGLDIVEMLWWRVITFAELGGLDDAIANLQEARNQATELTDTDLRYQALASLELMEADLKAYQAPARAPTLGSSAAKEAMRVSRLYATGILGFADRHLAALRALFLSLSIRQRQPSPADYDIETDMLLLGEIERRGPVAALERSEPAISSWVRELYPAPVAGRACTANEQELLPQDVTVLKYALAGNWLFVWVLRCDGWRFADVPAGRAAELARQLRQAAQNGPSARFQELAATAYDLLLRPVARYLPPEAALVIVLDSDLLGVPFGALLNRDTGRFLLEDREITFAPSATFFLTTLRQPTLSADPGDALLVSALNPDLKESGPEIEDLRRLYPRAQVIAGTDARRNAILDALDEHRMLHYVGHAVVDLTGLLRSRLPLTPDGAEEITQYDLEGRTFKRLELVVLSTCSSVGAAPGGFLGLARPFLEGGVRTVVGTLWDIDDVASRALLVAFHRELLVGRSPAAALRAAQLEALYKGWPPSAWAAFIVMGEGYK